MTTTITLTPTLTLSVADRRMQQSSIDDVWATIGQHIRATNRVSTIAVTDGHDLLRLWQLSPDGTREPIETDPTTTTVEADFRLLLSPWMMSVPYEDGPELKEVSTLGVARAQAAEAATAGNVDLILQTTGTDNDTSELIEPTAAETITASQDLDAEDDLMDDLADEKATPDEATRRFRRRMIIGGSALSLFLLATMTAGGWALLNGPDTPESQTSQTQDQAASTASASPEPTESATALAPQAIAPAGFSGTSDWEVVGATDQSSGMTGNGEHVGAVSGRALDVVSTHDGKVTSSVTLPATPDGGPYPLGHGKNSGLLIPTKDRIITWSEDDGMVESKIGKDNRLVLRGSSAFTVPQNDDSRPDAIQLVTTDGLREYTSPDGSAAAPIAPARSGGFLWASREDGGRLIHAEATGEETSSTRLIGPAKGTTISQWIGANENYVAAIWANDGSGSVLAIHDAETGKVVDTEDLGSTGAGASMRIVPSTDGRQLIAGSTLIDLETGKVIGPVDVGTSTTQGIQAVPGGWVTDPAAHTDSPQTLISPDGDTQDSPETTESLLGLTEDGALVVDNRGAIAAFTPDPETERNDQ